VRSSIGSNLYFQLQVPLPEISEAKSVLFEVVMKQFIKVDGLNACLQLGVQHDQSNRLSVLEVPQ